MPRPDVSEERRNQILEAAMSVFSRLGFHEARMDDIAQEAGLSKGALYLYYKSKSAIIGAILRYIFAGEMRQFAKLRDSEGSATERILRLTHFATDDFERMPLALPIMVEFYATAARDRSVRQFLQASLQDYTALMASLVQDGINSGEFRAANTHDVALALGAVYEGMVVLYAFDRQAVHLREHIDAAVRLILDGLRPYPS